MRRSILIISVAQLVLSFLGCSASPLERADTQELARESPLARTVLLSVECESPEITGAADEWLRDVSRGLRELNACAVVWTQDDIAAAYEKEDMKVRVIVKPIEPAPSKIDVPGASLDVLAWISVPLLPLWIPDVDTYPGIQLEVRGLSGARDKPSEDAVQRPSAAPVRTSFLDRYPFLSWQTLGGILVPPFVFKDGDAAYVNATAGERIRLEAAVQVAALIKRSSSKGELILGFSQTPRGLQIRPTPDLGLLTIRVAGQSAESGSYKFDPQKTGAQILLLDSVPGMDPARDNLLRITAYSRRKGGGVYRYSFLWKPPGSQEGVVGGGGT